MRGRPQNPLLGRPLFRLPFNDFGFEEISEFINAASLIDFIEFSVYNSNEKWCYVFKNNFFHIFIFFAKMSFPYE